MDNPVVISLVVSGIGMLMLFLALALLYGLMYLMTAVLKDKPEAASEKAEFQVRDAEGREQGARTRKRRAAAIAVAIARAELDLSSIGTMEPEGEAFSAWWALHHQRQLTRSVPTRRAR